MSHEPGATLLDAQGIEFSYGAIKALGGVDVSISEGEGVCIIGPNGAGKTTLARILGGTLQASQGTVRINGSPLPRRPHAVVRTGIASVLEGRRLFPDQSVVSNLELGAYAIRKKGKIDEKLNRVFELFPRLRERANQRAGTLSGGEQQMVAIGRALMAEPKLLILDEPSMGLSPIMASEVFDTLKELRNHGLAILLIEQNAALAFSLSQRGYVLQSGNIVLQGHVDTLKDLDLIRLSYLGETTLREEKQGLGETPGVSRGAD